jgi:succinoglycan biosynthesis protein ExoA
MSSLSHASQVSAAFRLEDKAAAVPVRVAEPPQPAAEMEPMLAVVPCFNEERHLRAVIGQILRQDGAEKITIVIADGASTDGTARIARELAEEHANVHYLHNPGRVQSIAVNLAVREFGEGFRYVARLDAHADYPPDYLLNLFREAVRTSADSVVVSMRTVGSGFVQSAVAAAQNSRLGNGGSAHRTIQADGRWVDHGHHALIRIAAFEAVGGYDERFSHNEDAEFDVRLAKAGFRCWLTNRTGLDYYPRSTVSGLFRQYVNYGRGRARTIFKHRKLPKLRQMLPLGVLPAVLLALLAPIWPVAAIPALTWAGLCVAYGLAIGVRERSLAAAAAGPMAMVIHLGWSVGFWDHVVQTVIGGRR